MDEKVRLSAQAPVPVRVIGAVWLDGTTVRVRQALGTRSVDLARADVCVEQVTGRTTDGGRLVIAQTPTLVARDPGSGRRVAVPLRLPGYELRRLADAMTLGRSAIGRDQDAHVIAGRLRAMAADLLRPTADSTPVES